MKILDCTFRDGGYYTNWNYDDDLVRETISVLDETNVDVIEMGYKSPLRGGKYRKCNDHFVQNVLGFRPKAQLSFMIDVKDFIFNNVIDYGVVKNTIKLAEDSIFDMCRVACTIDTLDYAIGVVNFLSSMGYVTTINLMRASLLDLKTLKKCVVKMNKSNLDILYLADSFGSFTAHEVLDYIKVYKDFSDKQFGFHSHNNMGLAFSNSIEAINNDVDYIDGTITGMGRGAGNVRLEQLLMYLGYDCTGLIDLIENKFNKLKNDYGWGWDINYMVTGLKKIHPAYCQILKSKSLSSSRIQNVLNDIVKKEFFDISEIEGVDKHKVSIIIPARYKSTRFPGKPVVEINGIPMVIRVANIAKEAIGKENVYIATDDERILDKVKEYNYKVIMTSDSALTGTDRVAEASEEIDSDIIINVQGDEPLLNPNHIKRVIEEKIKYPNYVIGCMSRIESYEKVTDLKMPKIIVNLQNELMYCSRGAIPSSKHGPGENAKKQVCITACNKDELKKFYERSKIGKTPLEWVEDIEINRFLELGMTVKMVEVEGSTYAVDFLEDVEIVERLLNEN